MTQPASWQLRMKLANDAGELVRLAEVAETFLEEQGISGRAAYTVQLALEEVVTNVIKYGYDDTGAHTIEVCMSIEGDWIALRVEDDGHEFDPLAAPRPDLSLPVEDRPIGGLGLHLVREMVEKVSYHWTGAANRVEMWIPLRDGVREQESTG